MGRSRYPRRGHRLAPAALADVLELPIAAKYRTTEADEGHRLCDLDESAWERWDEAACRELAGEVVRAVGRAARMPSGIGDRKLPSIPRGMRLTDLDLEVRTLNCLIAAGIHQRPQDLRMMTIEGLLGLRGFWVKCLVDLLTSLEYVQEHPEARRTLRSEGAVPLKASRSSDRYPRRGYRLAPAALGDILGEPIPEALVTGTRLEGKQLCDLDETVWEKLNGERIAALAELIVSRVNISGYNLAVQQRQLPRLPKGVRLEDLRLENRTFNCLRRSGFGKRPEDLARRTVGELLAIKAFGAKCLVDLLSSVETLAAREGQLDERLTAEARLLSEIPHASHIHFSDPRLGPLLRATDAEANTVGELVHHVLHRRLDPPDPLALYERVCAVRRKIEHLIELSLEEELIEVFSPPGGGRDKQIVAEYYGWDGSGGHTLEELGQKYGLSRERIRQVCVRAVKRSRGVRAFTPVLDRAMEFIAGRLPSDAAKLRTSFNAAGFSKRGLPLETVQQAARFLQRDAQFAVIAVGDRSLVVRPHEVDVPRLIVQAAKRAVLSYGTTSVSDVEEEVGAQVGSLDPVLVLETLKTLKDFEWLDERHGWFQLETLPQYGLPNMIEKVLSVAQRIEVSKLRPAIARYRRTGRNVPPARVLLAFCRRMKGVRVEGAAIVADPPKPWETVLAGVEACMVRVLREHGPILERGAFEEYCIREGMNRFSFNAIIMCSPVIAQYGRSVYGLIGAKVDRKAVETLAARKPGNLPSKVLRGFGRTEDGQVYLAYRLSKAAISGGVITVPSAMKEEVRGRFALRMPDGQSAGTLVSKSGCAWGLGPVLRGQHARPGDHLLLVFDTSAREVLIQLGTETVLEAIDKSCRFSEDLNVSSAGCP